MSDLDLPMLPYDQAEPVYDAMSREQIIAYCERLRETLMHANPLGLVHSGDFDAAVKWEREAVQAIFSHRSRP